MRATRCQAHCCRFSILACLVASLPVSLLALRVDRRSHAEDFLQAESGSRKGGAYGIARFAVFGTVGLVGKERGGGGVW